MDPEQEKICLASDNYTAAHPLVMEAVVQANTGCAPAYGADSWTHQAHALIQKAFKAKPKILIVPLGTGANILALRLACKRHESVICTDITHINTQETGAAEAVASCKLLSIPHQKGKATPAAVLRRLQNEKAFGPHGTLPRLLSITQPTEIGTVYTLDELKALAALCKKENLLMHIDGSRFYNAAAMLNVPLDQITSAASADLLSLGGTKNGLMCAESLLIFNPTLQEGADYLHKQTLQLASKMRFLSAQYIPFFSNELWRKNAEHANRKAKELASLVKTHPQFTLSYPVETNQLFFTAPKNLIPAIQDKIACYTWDEEKGEIRWIASWNTSEEEIAAVRAVLRSL